MTGRQFWGPLTRRGGRGRGLACNGGPVRSCVVGRPAVVGWRTGLGRLPPAYALRLSEYCLQKARFPVRTRGGHAQYRLRTWLYRFCGPAVAPGCLRSFRSPRRTPWRGGACMEPFSQGVMRGFYPGRSHRRTWGT